MRFYLLPIAVAAALAVPNSHAQTNKQTNVGPGADGLIRLEAKPELVDLIPTMAVSSLKQAVEFYVSKLGFELHLQSGNYVAIERDNVHIGFVYDKGAVKAYRPSFYIQMVRIDDYYKQVKAAGVKLATELKTSSSNMKEFSLTDPDGYTLIFGEYVGPK
ncbi:MAG: VOC family protein [Verrucomicrobiota bacterium]|jgi:catechol 2,3-dioxygenase-like lactoylglutathione lyase family enzyme